MPAVEAEAVEEMRGVEAVDAAEAEAEAEEAEAKAEPEAVAEGEAEPAPTATPEPAADGTNDRGVAAVIGIAAATWYERSRGK